MNKIFSSWKESRKRIEFLWDKTEALILRFFDAHEPGEETREETVPPLPKMTEFNVIVAAIKRLQDARIALLKEEAQYETLAETNDVDSKSAQEEISRILEALEKNGACETTDPDEMPE